MLLVDGEPVSSAGSSSTGSIGRELVAALMRNPGLCAASDRLRAAPERRISSGHEEPRHVYVFQREYATVDPARVELVGTDEMTTCVGVVIRNTETGMTSISHMDFPKIVEGGLRQMLELLGDDNTPFDVHLIGGFDDASTKVVHSSGRKHKVQEGYSHPLCCKIVEALHKSQQQFHLRSFCVLGNNTMTDSYGNARPIIGGFVMQTSSGVVIPASFDMASRCPDEIVRRIRVSVSSYDPSWKGRLLETYDTHSDIFKIAPACWMPNWAEIASSLNQLSDSEVLLQCSTSPAAEPPHFVETERRMTKGSSPTTGQWDNRLTIGACCPTVGQWDNRIWKYLIENPDWEDTFPNYKPRIFHSTVDGRWSRHS
ncbi:protein N-terminal asparagine amidohydrolase isoform X1 [Brachypodium distachyon]|uniref:protein N-terminal asparagine amidohydrolase isoform X1 n=1 Tax=Brachypodium distachyon TaxID=15368 RepID=UPI000D0D7ADF|nr:protein N-terminal asparagine amidohydrolase isoform X1 [Brachypodium distachyon]|eukprot:XP_024313122.1 protein N-terminal asparagine amidohydrolase isoform X1 [Brachypodium distachyon]